MPRTHPRVAPEGSRFLSVYHCEATAKVSMWSVVLVKVSRFSCTAVKNKRCLRERIGKVAKE